MRSFGSFTSEKGRVITFREPTKEDVTSLLDFVNGLIDEGAYIQMGVEGKHITLDEETNYVQDIISQQEKKEGIHILAFHESKLVGNAGIVKGSNRREHVGSLGIALHTDFRGEGIGSSLIQILLAQARTLGIQMVELKVYHENTQAIKLYEKLGFKEIGRFPASIKFKDDFIDEVWMYRTL